MLKFVFVQKSIDLFMQQKMRLRSLSLVLEALKNVLTKPVSGVRENCELFSTLKSRTIGMCRSITIA
jgi:hypothetical protein